MNFMVRNLEANTLDTLKKYLLIDIDSDAKKLVEMASRFVYGADSLVDVKVHEGEIVTLHKYLLEYRGVNTALELVCRLAYCLISPDLVDNQIIVVKLLIQINEKPLAHEWLKRIQLNDKLSSHDCAAVAFLLSQVDNNYAAINMYRRALILDEQDYLSWYNIGNCYNRVHQPVDAIQCYERSIRIKENQPLAWYNLGNSFRGLGRFLEAEKCYKYSLSLDSNFPSAFTNLGVNYLNMGRAEEALVYFKSAVIAGREDPYNWSGLALASQYLFNLTPHDVFEVHRLYGLVAEKSYACLPSIEKADATKIINVGFVGGDFKDHSVTNFLKPIFENCPKDKFQLYCFANNQIKDHITSWYISNCHGYYDVWDLSTSGACKLISDLRIDILIDLSGHTEKHRLDIFSKKPAPITVSWLGYPGTTGLKNMDFKIVCRATDAMEDTLFYTEKFLYLEPLFFCYEPHDLDKFPLVHVVPQGSNIRFGSFNHSAKYSPQILDSWCRILKSVGSSTLRLKSGCFSDPSCKRYYEEYFEEKGIKKERLVLENYSISKREHLNLYNEIDIALDVTPFSGATTTCEALAMGKPVVTVVGQTHAGRVTAAILKELDMPELISSDLSDYVFKACALSEALGSPKYRAETIATKFRKSKLCDSKIFAEKFYGLLEGIIHER